jgi:hypothetical protein
VRAVLAIEHDDYVHEGLAVSTILEPDPRQKQRGIRPVPPRFTHVLETARPIEGVVTSRRTGKPIADVEVEMIPDPMRPNAWNHHFHARTDASGRYRITGIAWNHGIYTNLFPPADSGFLAAQHHHEGQAIGGGNLRRDFTVKDGIVLRGRVIDGDTGRPIAWSHGGV